MTVVDEADGAAHHLIRPLGYWLHVYSMVLLNARYRELRTHRQNRKKERKRTVRPLHHPG